MSADSGNAAQHATTSRPLISVIMPCFNAAAYVSDAIGSVLEQTHGNVELLVVEDGSTDGSADIIQKLAEQHPQRLRLLYSHRAGQYRARNMALRHVNGELIAFLDADDWWLPQTLEKLCATLAAHSADMAYCGWQNVGEGIGSAPYVPAEYEKGDPMEAFLRSCPWPIHAVLVKRELADRLGGFSERRYASMDYDFWLRALALTRNMVRVPEVLAFYRWHSGGQVSAVKWRQVLDALAAQHDFIRNNPELVAHLSPERLHELTEGQVLHQAYRALWRRDLISAHKLFRHVAAKRSFRLGDVRHVVSALLPLPTYRWLVGLIDRRANQRADQGADQEADRGGA